jgi:hypothetical protein
MEVVEIASRQMPAPSLLSVLKKIDGNGRWRIAAGSWLKLFLEGNLIVSLPKLPPKPQFEYRPQTLQFAQCNYADNFHRRNVRMIVPIQHAMSVRR